jgi:microcystin-dependent protein
MTEPFIGEIKLFAGNFAIYGYAFCNGQLLPISQYDALYNLIGTTYGGDGLNTFGLPNLQGCVPVHMGTAPTGTTYVLGQQAGAATVTLSTNQLPAHNHQLVASLTQGTTSSPSGTALAAGAGIAMYSEGGTPDEPMATQSTGPAGGSLPHDNMQPYLTLNFIIALQGVYPSPS